MWKLLFVVAAVTFSASPLDAAPRDGKDADSRERGELARDVERISREIYPPPTKATSGADRESRQPAGRRWRPGSR
jgi:hypothetical protein